MSAAIVLLLPLVYVALQWAALRRMRHGWQLAAIAPAAGMAAALAVLAVGIAIGADFAAVGLMLGLPLATGYLLVLLLLHGAFSQRR